MVSFLKGKLNSLTRDEQIYQLEKDWSENPRWEYINRSYSAKEVVDFCIKDINLYSPFYDETIMNVLIWQKGGQKYLPRISD